ncbi:DUF2231 domain-containing protein [Micropruina sp.]|uniref:DUF2231 domain-containing protein n=1 Tax=Micropruina sp. TaxID=2737536 RepID=UPI0039E56623
MDVFGLPLHPLVVHGAVVLVPLAALGALAVLFSSWVRARYGWLTVLVAVAGAAATLAARLSGPALADQISAGGPAFEAHEMWGQLAVFPAVALALLLPCALWAENRSRAGWWVLVALTAISAVAGLVLVVLTGHSGATAVWGG